LRHLGQIAVITIFVGISTSVCAQGPSLVRQRGHDQGARKAILDSKGKILATLGGSYICLWEVATGVELRVINLNLDIGAVDSIAFSPDSKLIAAAGFRGVQLIDTTIGSHSRLFNWPPTRAGNISLSFSQNGKLVAAGLGSKIRLLNVESGEFIESFASSGTVLDVAFSADGSTLASVSNDGSTSLWNVRNGAKLLSHVHADKFLYAKFSNDPRRVAFVRSGNAAIQLSDSFSGRELQTLKLELDSNQEGVNSIAFSSDGTLLAASTRDEVGIWEVSTGREVTKFADLSSPVLFSPDGNLLAESDNVMQFYDIHSHKLVCEFKGNFPPPISDLRYSPDGRLLAIGIPRTIEILDTTSGQILQRLDTANDNISGCRIAFSPNGKLLASVCGENTIRIWDVNSGVQVRSISSSDSESFVSIAFSPDGKLIAGGGSNRQSNLNDSRLETMHLWCTASGTKVASFAKLEPGTITTIAFSPDSKLLASGGSGLQLWDITTRSGSRILNRNFTVKQVAFSPDGKSLASVGVELIPIPRIPHVYTIQGFIRLTDVRSRKTLRVFGPYRDVSIHSIDFSPTVHVLAAAGSDNLVRLVDLVRGKELNALAATHLGDVYSCSFRSDGKILVTADDSTIRMWNARTWKEIASLFAAYKSPNREGVMSSNESSAIANLRTIFSAEATYVAVYPGRYLDLQQLVDTNLIDKSFVEGGKHGYRFELRLKANGQSYELLAEPLVYGTTGRRRFISDESGRILRSERMYVEKPRGAVREEELKNLYQGEETVWLTVGSDARFDTRDFAVSRGLHWVMQNDPFRADPLEIFMRDYYEPRLLPRLLKCNVSNNCHEDFRQIRSLEALNRAQPSVKIVQAQQRKDKPELADVTVEVGEAVESFLRSGEKVARRSGIYDLRLFRDGQLVGYTTRVANSATENPTISNKQNIEIELQQWRARNKLASDHVAHIGTGKCEPLELGTVRCTFTVRLQRRNDFEAVEFTAYAFNEDRVKSETSREVLELKAPVPVVKPRAYVISVGINEYDNPAFRQLSFAVADAIAYQQVVCKLLQQTGEYEVVAVALLSGKRNDGVTERLATKQNIKAILDVLAGHNDPKTIEGIAGAKSLKRAEPEDMVLLSFSGHGYADARNNFYVIPQNTSAGAAKYILEQLISSEELSWWLRDIDAGEMSMIIDACHSAGSVDAPGFKPGPLGDRGLGQLAYDKGMRILAATQRDDVALELDVDNDGTKIGQGLLTYALIHDGLENKQADSRPQDGRITIKEWLAYGERRVPELYKEGIRVKDNISAAGAKSAGTKSQPSEAFAQTPSFFDFNRNTRDVILVKAN